MASALEGIRVLDLSRTFAGPFCAMLLGDMGADVVKLEEPEQGDETRSWPPFWNGQSVNFLPFNRNKRSITLNLKSPEGRAIAARLAERSDVVIESFRTGAAERLGLGYEELRQRSPQLVYLSISGYGRTGPMAHRPGYDLMVQGAGGLISVTGEPGRPPVRVGYSVVDIFCGMAAYGAVLTALYHRERTGQGQYVEASLLDGQVTTSSYHAVSYLATGKAPGPMGSGHPSVCPYQAFQAKDGWFILGVANDNLWRRFCAAVKLDHLVDDPRYRATADRVAHREELIGFLNELFRHKTVKEWTDLIAGADVPCGPINTVAQVVNDPQIRAREAIVSLPHPDIPDLRMPGPPFRPHATPATYRRYPPRHGEHTEEVLRELGYTPDDVEMLKQEGAI
ncbi:MAG: CoA transferase [Chloroflexi bacterium]|nr:CoA transferase [Chloroflexota bacterium]